MATGDVHWFNEALTNLGTKLENLTADALLVGIVTTGVVPTIATVGAHWAGTGTTNFATTQVAITGTSYTGPKALTTVTWANAAGVSKLAADIITMAQDASGFANGAYGIIYDSTDANKRALGFVELSAAGSLSLVAGQVVIKWNNAASNGTILQITNS
jgi:hypothetical protein